MTMNDLLEIVSKSFDILEAENTQLKAEIEALVIDAVAAHDAYYEDVRQKEGTIKKRLAFLNEMLANFETKEGQTRKAYTAAVIANDTSKMDSLQAALAKLANQKLSTSAQIEALRQVNVKDQL